MEQDKREQIALFRFGVISALVNLRSKVPGERERIIRQITQQEWQIPGSHRSSVCRSTVLEWLRRYTAGGGRLESLYPQQRADKGLSKSLDTELQQALVRLRQEERHLPLPAFIVLARRKGIIGAGVSVSRHSLRRLFKRQGLLRAPEVAADLRSFEAELPNDLWQADCMHGPLIVQGGKKRKTYLFACIDDHSRLIVWAQFYLRENLESLTACVRQALSRRGLPRQLYVDNGPSFRSQQLRRALAKLGVALAHSRPYHPQGKGKIERWFRTVRSQFLSTLAAELSIEALNRLLSTWIEQEYHQRVHTSTGQAPLERFLAKAHLLRPAPDWMDAVFCDHYRRKVSGSGVVSLLGASFEAPAGCAGQKVLLRVFTYPHRIETLNLQEQPIGWLRPLDAHLNCRLRAGRSAKTADAPVAPVRPAPLHSGELFGGDNNAQQKEL